VPVVSAKGLLVRLGAYVVPYTPAQRWADVGLGCTSLLFWNYAMRHRRAGPWYGIVRGMDFVMIGTNAVVSTFATSWMASARAGVATSAALASHFVASGGLRRPNAYRTHVHLCALSAVACVVRVFRAPSRDDRWLLVARAYGAIVCTALYYGRFRSVTTVQEFRAMPWWLPWVWHAHTAGSMFLHRVMLHGRSLGTHRDATAPVACASDGFFSSA
jgi:hypothetical protein